MAEDQEMYSFVSRLRTFEVPHQLSKRRASAQTGNKKKGGGNTIEWPHEHPSPDALARAGFFYRPSQDSADNVQCFHCAVKLDGWDPADDAIKEHLAHSASCQWAQSCYAGIAAQQDAPDGARNPMDEELVAARRGTFEAGSGWPHESKRGWKCKIAKMVDAGWCLDPAPKSEDEEGDGVTCFYCALSLDGWEPKDDPFQEHKKRSPDCAFFRLVEKFGSAGDASKKAKGKGRGKAAARDSTASKASRLSVQSVQSNFSEAASLPGFGTAEDAAMDDSINSIASQATITGTIKGKKKGGRAKAAATGAKGRPRAGTVDSEADATPMYLDLNLDVRSQPAEENILSPTVQIEPAPLPGKKTRKGTRQSKQPLDSSAVEISAVHMAPAKKPTRSRKANAAPEAEPEDTADADAELDNSEVSAQLQEELERSMDMDIGMENVVPQPEPLESKRGTKRTSDGLKKQQEEEAASSVIDEFPAPPHAAPVPKGKKGRKPSKQATEESRSDRQLETQDDVPVLESEAGPVKTKSKKAPAKKGTRTKKASSVRSSRSSKATVIAEMEATHDEPEDLERDEREIEAELERIAAEQAMQAEQEKTTEFEPSPSHAQRQESEMRQLERELQAEASERKAPRHVSASRQPSLVAEQTKDNATSSPSPSGSDKENQPSAKMQSSAKHPAAAAVILSPTKTVRIPLAPGTPNRLSPSKSRALLLSPSKHISHLTSNQPWEAVDLDTILLASPQPTPGTLSQRLAGAVGALASPEKGLTVEEWVRYQADRGERELKRRCEEMVGMFEREGMRGINCLEGIPVVS